MCRHVQNTAVPARGCLHVRHVFVFFIPVCVLPSVLMAHHGKHCRISASLGLSQRLCEGPDPAGNGPRRENGKGIEEEVKQDSVLKNRR